MKKLLFTIVFVSILILSACNGEKSEHLTIPDVFGVGYSDAMEVLEAEGFEVKAIETDVAGISEKLLYPLEKVSKGSVFKIDNYILDNNGNLTKDYDVFYDGELVSDDTSIIVYYASEDYVLDTVLIENITKKVVASVNAETEKNNDFKETIEASETESEKMRSDFIAAMDSYEDFMDKYVAFMKKYMNNPSDSSLLMDFADYSSKYAEFVSDFDNWESEELSDAELKYYIEVQTRVNKKLAEVV